MSFIRGSADGGQMADPDIATLIGASHWQVPVVPGALIRSLAEVSDG